VRISALVELFDRHGVTFVAVTQQFNTTTSMGRLTLNILLSFAQFEREVIGERVRDKIAASKKKGMWMGGVTPLGYAIKDRKLEAAHPQTEPSILEWRPHAGPKRAAGTVSGSVLGPTSRENARISPTRPEYRDTRTGWLRGQSRANPSLAGNSLLTGKITGNFAKSEPIGASVAGKRVAATTG
jgi:hypothetical protein